MPFEFTYDQNTQAGLDYQIRLLELFLIQGVANNVYSFVLHTEVKEGDKFDDVVFQYINKNGRNNFILIQAKHKQDADKSPISYENLFDGKKSKEFFLLKYYLSYQEIKKRQIFEEANIEKLVIFTNTNFTEEVYKKVRPVKDEGENIILENFDDKSALLKFKGDFIVSLLKPKIEEHLIKVAEQFAKCILGNLRIDAQSFDLCHIFLAESIVDTKNKQFFENFVNNENLSEDSRIFRSNFDSQIRKISKNTLTLENINKAILEKQKVNQKQIGMNLTKCFGKGVSKKEPDNSDIDTNIKDFLDCLTFAVNQPNDKEMQGLIKRKIKTEFKSHPSDSQIKLYEAMKEMSQAQIRKICYADAKELTDQFYIHFNVSKPIASFIGRDEELQKLHSKIQENQKATVITTISGLGGIGKTQLARQYVKVFSHEYNKNIVWINSENEATIADCFRRLAGDELEIELRNKDGDDKNIRSIVESVYRYFAGKKILFVFDNCEDTKLFNKYLPGVSNNAFFLVTSRNRKWGRDVAMIDLAVLTEGDAMDLIKKELKIETHGTDSEILNLARILQCLPLALQQAISYITNTNEINKNYKITDYLREFEGNSQALLENDEFLEEFNEMNYTKTTFTTWIISLKTIESHERLGQLALRVLKAIIYINPENIQRALFLELKNINEADLYPAIDLLIRYSIINGKNNQEILDIHRLAQHVIRLHEKGNEKENLKNTLALLESTKINVDIHKGYIWENACKRKEFIKEFIIKKHSSNPNQISPLYYIIRNSQLEALKTILKYIKTNHPRKFNQIINKHVNEHTGNTYLLESISLNNFKMVQLLIQEGIDINTKNYKKQQAIHYAVREGNKDIVDLLLKNGASANATYENKTLLHNAIQKKHTEVVKSLLEYGADASRADDAGIIMLHYAVEEECADIVELLLEHGTNVNALDEETGHTVLYFAASLKNKNVAELLLKKGADVNIPDRDGKLSLHHTALWGNRDVAELVLKGSTNINAIDQNNRTALHDATLQGNKHMVELLLQNGIDVNAADIYGQTALHYAAEEDNRDVTELLLKYGADINVVDENKRTALHYAAPREYKFNSVLSIIDESLALPHVILPNRNGAAKVLLKNGADANLTDSCKKTILHYAAEEGRADVAELALETGVDVNATDSGGETALHHAVYWKNKDVVEILLKNGINVNAVEHDGQTALHHAAYQGCTGIIQVLLENGAYVKVGDKSGQTALHYAAYRGHEDTVELLLVNGACINAVDNDGNTVLYYAALGKHKNVENLLRANSVNVNDIG